MSERQKATTPAYRKNWDRIFKKPPNQVYRGKPRYGTADYASYIPKKPIPIKEYLNES